MAREISVLATTALSGAGTTNGGPILLEDQKRVGVGAIWTGTLSGTFTWQWSNDFDPKVAANATWNSLTVPASFASGNPTGAAGSFLFDFTIAPAAKAIRPVYTNASGAGNLTITAALKGH